MPQAQANAITIEYETFGRSNGRTLLLIMGLASQLIAWPKEFCEMLAANGHFVVRFDNRDVGLSTKLESAEGPDILELMAALRGQKPLMAPYSLSDMAADALGLMDALGLEKAHVCGLSLGGMIAQTMAIEHPERLYSLISMESSTGEPDLPAARPEALEAFMSAPPLDRQGYIRHIGRVFRAFAGQSDHYDQKLEEETAAQAYDRSFYPMGFVRQLAAIMVSGGRRRALQTVSVPTLVIHGANDALVPVQHGHDTAAAIPGARLLVLEGLGHGLSYPALWDQIVEAITNHTRQASA
jgi:pimeloyl-ACP methyl ester carboxylesterase